MGKQLDKEQNGERASTAGPVSTTTRAARRHAWNTSTRLSVKTRPVDSSAHGHTARPQRKEREERNPMEQGIEEGKTERHSRCSSPSCRDRRSKRQIGFAEAAVATHQPLPVVNSTRAMIERAVDSALSSAMEDADLTLDKSVELEDEQPREQQQPQLLDLLTTADADATEWRRQYVNRRQHNDRVVAQQRGRTHKATQVQREIWSARFEYEQRKLEIQSLQQRVQREIHFLQATAAELAQREKLMDEAFAGYEQWVQSEWEEANAHAG